MSKLRNIVLISILSFVLLSSTLISAIPFDARGSSETSYNQNSSSPSTNRIAESESRAPEFQVNDESEEEKKVNQAPAANAGPDVTVNENQKVTLSADRSKDVDGDDLSYTWTQISPKNPKVNLKNSHSEKILLDIPDVEKSMTFRFLLTVDDGEGGVDKDQMSVRVNNIAEEKNKSVTSTAERDSTIGVQEITNEFVGLDDRIGAQRV